MFLSSHTDHGLAQNPLQSTPMSEVTEALSSWAGQLSQWAGEDTEESGGTSVRSGDFSNHLPTILH